MNWNSASDSRPPPEQTSGGVRIRSNVVRESEGDAWHLVPGEIVERFRQQFAAPNRPPQRQRAERMYYEPCGICGRTIAVINVEGCDQCSHAPPPEVARRNRERHNEILS